MVYSSATQRRYFNAQRGKKIPAKVVDEFNKESRGKKLPEKVKTHRTFHIEKSKKNKGYCVKI